MLLAMWSAIGVFLVACVAGFVQLRSDDAPTARNKLSAFMSTTLHLYWPLILLPVCTVWLWFLAAENTLQLYRGLRVCVAGRKPQDGNLTFPSNESHSAVRGHSTTFAPLSREMFFFNYYFQCP
ncbi:hypothetical protein TraAM80_08402 [Trypanosoma rangeli]|uniref:Uncharacterized protein n=1 Tax=Trypanosoma rangeli TaxID=5698 RepID=A0A3R7RAZ3_TRYRA|nr:uncharacterized protein TraAM80_08402 [Trypanosoma rangeli]RNE99078.1 hypothetical protein TraAM80_08402 [Trypanosoma rangeli]|eukprot:RNE99078.1 hypothetical protein TraAM80_08402 [Trypanosoma rangeli]